MERNADTSLHSSHWDPFQVWPRYRRAIYAVLSLAILALQGPAFIRSIGPPADATVDFFQDWASARNLLNGQSAYGDITPTAQDYLGSEAAVEAGIRANAHPPASVLIVAPFALLDYPTAMIAWNLVSLGLLVVAVTLLLRSLSLRLPVAALVPAAAMLLMSPPVHIQVSQGQFNFVLLALIVGAWLSARTDRPVLAGVLIGGAAAIKLFPALLLVHYALRRQWRIVISGSVVLTALTAISVAIVGTDAAGEYATRVVPAVDSLKGAWRNVSLHGLWWKLLSPGTGVTYVAGQVPSITQVKIDPVVRSAALAGWASLGSVLLLLVFWIRGVLATGRHQHADIGFGLALVVMLLVSPVTWLHYLVLLIPTFFFLWYHLSGARRERYAWLILLFAVMGPVWELTLPLEGGVQTYGWPMVLTVLSLPTWGLVGTFMFCRRKLVDPADHM